jgi:hypothetical protein
MITAALTTALQSDVSALERIAADMRREYSAAQNTGACDMWLIDHCGATILCCRGLASSRGQMHLRVPIGYGTAEGQRYELSWHPPGANIAALPGPIVSRWVRVVRVEFGGDVPEEHLDVTLAFEQETASRELLARNPDQITNCTAPARRLRPVV